MQRLITVVVFAFLFSISINLEAAPPEKSNLYFFSGSNIYLRSDSAEWEYNKSGETYQPGDAVNLQIGAYTWEQFPMQPSDIPGCQVVDLLACYPDLLGKKTIVYLNAYDVVAIVSVIDNCDRIYWRDHNGVLDNCVVLADFDFLDDNDGIYEVPRPPEEYPYAGCSREQLDDSMPEIVHVGIGPREIEGGSDYYWVKITAQDWDDSEESLAIHVYYLWFTPQYKTIATYLGEMGKPSADFYWSDRFLMPRFIPRERFNPGFVIMVLDPYAQATWSWVDIATQGNYLLP